MNEAQFNQKIQQFMQLHCAELAPQNLTYIVRWFDPEEPESIWATINMKTRDHREWQIPVGLNCDTANDEQIPGIIADAEKGEFLDLDAAGLYCFLWQEAVKALDQVSKRLNEVTRKV